MAHAHILSVLIADDEKPIREELRMFDWESCCAVMVGEATNGVEALRMCREYQPDLLIADITMPLMDGISLMASMKERYPRTQVVLLTCHSSFEYAREAIRMGAVSYIVKVTMTDEEIGQAVAKARENIERQEKLDFYSRESERQTLTAQFVALLGDPPGRREIPKLSLPFPSGFIRLVVDFHTRDWIFVDRQIRDCLDDSAWRWFPLKVGEYILIWRTAAPDQPSCEVENLIQTLLRNFESNMPYLRGAIRIYALVSRKIHCARDIPPAYRALEGGRIRHFYEPENRMPAIDSSTVQELTADRREKFESTRQAAWQVGRESPRASVGAFRQWTEENCFDPEKVKNYAVEILMKTAAAFSLKLPVQEAVQKIAECRDAGQLESMMNFLLETGSGHTPKESTPIRIAKDVIHERLGRTIDLRSVAESVGLSPNYFSRIFSEQTGVPFNEYVTQQRMEKAVWLLEHSSLKVYEVAEKIGIPSYRYFSSLFKSWTGKTPKEYQKKC